MSVWIQLDTLQHVTNSNKHSTAFVTTKHLNTRSDRKLQYNNTWTHSSELYKSVNHYTPLLANGHLPLVLALYTTIHIIKILKVINNNNNNNNTNDTVYSAVIMASPLQEFTRFITWMQTRRQAAINPQIKPTDLGCESTCRLPLTTLTDWLIEHGFTSASTQYRL